MQNCIFTHEYIYSKHSILAGSQPDAEVQAVCGAVAGLLGVIDIGQSLQGLGQGSGNANSPHLGGASHPVAGGGATAVTDRLPHRGGLSSPGSPSMAQGIAHPDAAATRGAVSDAATHDSSAAALARAQQVQHVQRMDGMGAEEEEREDVARALTALGGSSARQTTTADGRQVGAQRIKRLQRPLLLATGTDSALRAELPMGTHRQRAPLHATSQRVVDPTPNEVKITYKRRHDVSRLSLPLT